MPAVRTAHPRVLVIGASRGLGRAIVDEYLSRGADVVATVRRPDQSSLDGAEDAAADGRLRLEHVDITVTAAVRVLRERLSGQRFDLLFVVAGVTNGRAETPATVTTDEFVRVMVTNALSPMRTVEALSDLVPTGGTIAVMSSGQGSIANNRTGDFEIYRASKSALNQLMRSYAAPEARPDAAADRARLGADRVGRCGGCADRRRERARRRLHDRCPARDLGPAVPGLRRPNVPLVSPAGGRSTMIGIRSGVGGDRMRAGRDDGMARAAGLALGYLADQLLGDPRRGHPVAGFGRTAAALERRSYRDTRIAGTVHTVVLVGAAAGLGVAADRLTRTRPVARTLVTAAATWAVLGGRSLRREATAVGALLDAPDLAGARRRITHLVGRDPATLDEAGIARACVESVAENTSDAVVAPLIWGAVAGVPGLLGYRAVNTLDAMVGHRSARYERFGWAAARLDDLANLVPARLSAGLAAAAAPLVGGMSRRALRAVRRDAGKHPSPNAGPVEAAFAGALGRTLGGVNTYGDTVEDRGTLGDGPPPAPEDIARAVRLSALVGAGVVIGATAGAASVFSRREPLAAKRSRTRPG